MKMPWFFHDIFMAFFIAFSWYFLLNFHGVMKIPWKYHEKTMNYVLFHDSWNTRLSWVFHDPRRSWIETMKIPWFSIHGIFMVHVELESRPWKTHDLGFIDFSCSLRTWNSDHEKPIKIFHGKFMVLWGHKIPVKTAIFHVSLIYF